VVRAPRPDELERLRDIERAAGRAFVDVGMPDIAADEPPSAAVLDRYRRAGWAWVVAVAPAAGDGRAGGRGSGRGEAGGGDSGGGEAGGRQPGGAEADNRDADGVPAAYVIADVLDRPGPGSGGAAHVEQVSVDPAFAGRGWGRRLLDHVADHARRQGLAAVTLTTFRDVPWNAPYYERCGFRALSEDELGPDLRRLRAAEAAHGLDPALRVCMRRDL
jgi:GNAT superfamily N-acetyltransferase